MEEQNPSRRLAVLIDGENVSHKEAARIFELVAPLGRAYVRAVYGDFSGPARSWKEAAARHAIEYRHLFPASGGKNSADIALVIDAMDLLRDGAAEGFCIVSSDGDFAGLARRIRAEGLGAYGIGRAAAPELYRLACTEFFVLDPAGRAEEAEVSGSKAGSAHPALPAIRAAVNKMTHRGGWYCLSVLGSEAALAGWRKKFGSAKLGDLLRETRQFEVKGQLFRPEPLRVVA